MLDVFDGGLVGEVDGLGDRAADERLGGGHHADVAFDGDEALADACRTCWRSRRRGVLVLEVRGAFDGAAAADDVVGFVDLLLGEAELSQQIEAGRLPFGFGDVRGGPWSRSPSVQGLKAKEISNWPGRAASILSSSSSVKPESLEACRS